MQKLTTKFASVKTATVTLGALVVNGKQVTLSVFRQLKEEHILDEAFNLRGVPWGVVNYHWGECKNSPHHFHAVWQSGEELRRNQIYVEPGRALFESYEDEAARQYKDYLISQVLNERASLSDGMMMSPNRQPIYLKLSQFQHLRDVELSEGESTLLKAIPEFRSEQAAHWFFKDWLKKEDYMKAWESLRETFVEATYGEEPITNTPFYYRRFQRALEATIAVKKRRKEIIDSLQNLDQIFIAV